MIIEGLLLHNAYERPEPGWLAVQDDRIVEVGHGRPPQRPDLGDPQALICPGFIDAHIHLPQIDSIGCEPAISDVEQSPRPLEEGFGTQASSTTLGDPSSPASQPSAEGSGGELLAWLERVIYPAEARWAFQPHAAQVVEKAYRRMYRAGTLGYAGYLTSHFHGYIVTVRAGYQLPLRAIVGQSLMDRNAPEELVNQPIARIAQSQRARLAASVNPRFAVSCSDALLDLSRTKARPGTFIQTHLAETRAECELVRRLFPDDPHYTGVYDRHGLLTSRTLLAHCVHLSDAEWSLIAKRRSVVVHCPGANVFLRSGLFDLDKAREHGVRLALGSDIAAGPDIAMPRVARAMIEMAKLRAMSVNPRAYVPTPAEAWQMITRGNADALGWRDAGRLEVGAMADVLILRPDVAFDEHMIGRLLYTWRDEYIEHRIVAGKAHGAARELQHAQHA